MFAFRAAGGPSAQAGATARSGGLLFLAFHGAPIEFQAAVRQIGGRAGGPVSVTLGLGALLGALVVVIALGLAGRAAARRWPSGATGSTGSTSERSPGTEDGAFALGLRGAAVAVPYAGLAAIVAALSRVNVSPPGTSVALITGSVAVRTPLAMAVLLPAAVAAAAGFVGGASGGLPRGRATARDLGFGHAAAGVASVSLGSNGSRLASALTAGAGGVAIGLAASFVGLLILALVDGGARDSYFHAAFAHGAARGVAVLGLTALTLPTMCTWMLSTSMGSCIAVARTVGRAAQSSCALSYAHAPAGPPLASLASQGGAVPSGRAPSAGYLLFLLVPFVTVMATGWFGARRSEAARAERSFRADFSAGISAGAVFGAVMVPLLLVSRVWASLMGPGASGVGGAGTVSVGPAIVLSIGLTFAWALIGGAAGGGLHGLRAWRQGASMPAVRERVFGTGESPRGASGPEAPPQP